jgi:hypothetical protein
VGRGECIWASKVPHKVLSPLPRVQGCAIGSFTVFSEKAWRFQLRVNFDGSDSPDKYIVCQGVASMTTSTFTAGQPMMAVLGHFSPADTGVGTHEGGSDAQPYRDSKFVIPHPKTDVR